MHLLDESYGLLGYGSVRMQVCPCWATGLYLLSVGTAARKEHVAVDSA